ncbi:MAG: Na+/H+ antiporter subunit E [Candidatus Latescibacterota bacterium]|nr:MAG: Na+/H+ antiporter subunit E [Candidatus Latescibacterota bacterium]HDI00069.1 Na+/H+ antiporter subunit E [Bacillota bacterium]
MVEESPVRSFVYLFVFLVLIWLALTSTFQVQELVTGLLISFFLSLFLAKNYSGLGLPPFSVKRLVFFIVYIPILLWEIIKANFDVAYRVIHPKMPIRPGIVVIRTGLKTDIAKTILANSITLTPGTFTLDIIGDKLLVHWINVKAEDIERATELIGGRFEKYLKNIFS